MSDSDSDFSDLSIYTIDADSASNKECGFLDFLGIAQSLKIDFLPITRQPALNKSQMPFVFKRLMRPRSAMEKTQNLRELIAEISILGHPDIRYHSNIAKIEGICWDYGDLSRFMTSESGKKLDFKSRLDILFDVALAVRDLHTIGVIHGNMKPENILISSENDGRYVAKVIDFGYSTLFTTNEDLIRLPCSRPWTAPEWHHMGFLPTQAKKMDAYSFGMLCLWLLFYSNGANRDWNFGKDLEAPLHDAFELLRATADLENSEKNNMQKLFRSTLAQDPAERTANFNELLDLIIT